MTDQTDIPQLDTVDAVIDALSGAPLLEVYRTLLPFDDGMVTAAAVKGALAGGGGGVVASVTVEIATEDLAVLNSSPLAVIPAPGAGKIAFPVIGAIEYLPGDFPFGTGNADFDLIWANGGFFAAKARPDTAPFDTLNPYFVVFTPAASSLTPEGALDDAENQPVRLRSADSDIGFSGSILASSIQAAGADYEVGDTITFTLTNTGTKAVVEVDTVDGAGAVLTYHVTNAGSGYTEASNPEQDSTSGAGTGFELSVDSITPLSDGTARITLLYYLQNVGA